ncbi:type VII secretion integral membrane protein EccD [Motilibacter aurantiacus]|uniref:type VII secretion integral membrane protein EccD n=1 Tax=Motilibacter aurantiacus TaxID=2714955 RepID=UPI00140A666B|nr:type VII secretion integral membrane protein EccD [Motilibacter aurantiacus]NHC44041.1 type VII secretion integral membrane protein EccD [Motilibacter aurantiacus]
MARVTVVAPHTRVDLALPHAATLAELLPALLRVTGEDLAGDARPGGDWSLARFAEPPLDPGRTFEALALRDGELLYLSPRAQQQPAPVFDDVVDAVASAAGDPLRRWGPRASRLAGLLAAVALLAGAAFVASYAATDGAASTAVTATATAAAGGAALVLVLVAAVLSRAFGDAAAGGAAAGSGAVAAAAAGVAAAVTAGAPGDGRAALACAGGSVAFSAALGALAVGDFGPAFAAVAVLAAGGAAAALGTVALDASTASAAAVTAALALALQPVLPALALRLARLPLPRLPADLTGAARDDDALAGVDTVHRAAAASRFLAALVVALGVLLAASGVLLAIEDSVAARWLGGIVAVAAVLRSRTHAGTLERGALLLAGAVPAAVLVARLVADAAPATRVAAGAATLFVAGLVALWATLATRGLEPSPYWWRALDLLELAALVAVLPVLLAVTGSYGYVRGLGG